MASRMVPVPNFHPTEGACKCGCGLCPSDYIVFAVQALGYDLAREYGGPVMIIVMGGARCHLRHQWVYDNEVNPIRIARGLKPKIPPKDSRHLPQPGEADPRPDALDVRMKVQIDGKWTPIPLDVIALHARKIGLFGGIGLTEYQQDGRDIVHLDGRPGKPVTW